jgi:hypothetical protein
MGKGDERSRTGMAALAIWPSKAEILNPTLELSLRI